MEQVIFLGAHPDDFTSCCGTALLMRGKFGLHIWDYTRGENGLSEQGVSWEECARLRTAEEMRVAEFVGAELKFLGEINGSCYVAKTTCEQMAQYLRELNPRAIFTHFVPDRHPDHMMTTAALFRALSLACLAPEIYFYEFSHQSLGFKPGYIVDITAVMDAKIKLIRMYECQNQNDSIAANKRQIAEFRGLQGQCRYGEAFSDSGFRRENTRCILNEL